MGYVVWFIWFGLYGLVYEGKRGGKEEEEEEEEDPGSFQEGWKMGDG